MEIMELKKPYSNMEIENDKPRLDLSKIDPRSFNCLVVGASGTGKTTLVSKLISEMGYKRPIYWCDFPEGCPKAENIIVYSGDIDGLFQKIEQCNNDLIIISESILEVGNHRKVSNTLVQIKSKLNMPLIMESQYFSFGYKEARRLFNYMCFRSFDSISTLDRLFKCHFGEFETMKKFRKFFKYTTRTMHGSVWTDHNKTYWYCQDEEYVCKTPPVAMTKESENKAQTLKRKWALSELQVKVLRAKKILDDIQDHISENLISEDFTFETTSPNCTDLV